MSNNNYNALNIDSIGTESQRAIIKCVQKEEVPNRATLAAFNEAEKIKSGKIKAKRYSDVNSLMQDLLA